MKTVLGDDIVTLPELGWPNSSWCHVVEMLLCGAIISVMFWRINLAQMCDGVYLAVVSHISHALTTARWLQVIRDRRRASLQHTNKDRRSHNRPRRSRGTVQED